MQLIKFEGLSDAENAKVAKLLSYEVSHNKLWNSDTGRSLTGAFSGKIIGIFPKLSITIKAQNKNDRAKILSIFNSDFKKVQYYDPEYKAMVEKTFYFGDVNTQVKKAVTESKIRYTSMTCEIVATTKRTRSDIV